MKKIDCLILDVLSDDFENLEQIYKSICFDFYNEDFESNLSYFKPKPDIFLLEEIIDSIIELRENGMIELVNTEAEYINIPNSYLWRCWFKLTDKGRKTLDSLDL